MSDFIFGTKGAFDFADKMPEEKRAPSYEVTGISALGLSNVDLKLLHGASNGMVDKLIAKQLQLPAHRVHACWRWVRRALRAMDRSHAVAIALSLGAIAPPAHALALNKRLQNR